MTVTVRALPTPYDPPTGPLTVATPSCCCCSCCCCCLNALSAGVGVTAGAAYGAAVHNRRPVLLPTLLGVLAIPAVLGIFWLLTQGEGDTSDVVLIVVPILTYLALGVTALHLAGTRRWTGVLVAGGIAASTAVLFFMEIFVAAVTAFLIELAFPLSMVGGWFLGRQLMGGRDDPPGPAGYRGHSSLPPAPGAWPTPGEPPWPRDGS